MKIKKCFKVMVLIFCLFQGLFRCTYAAEDYSLEVERDYKITWEFKKVDSTLLEYIKNNYSTCLTSLTSLNVKKGATMSYRIKSINEYDDYWEMQMDSSVDSETSTTIVDVYKDPNNIQEDYLSDFMENILRVLPVDTADYLENLADRETSSKDMIATSSGRTFNFTYIEGENTMLAQFKYKDNGIINEFEFVYNNQTAIKYEFSNYEKVSNNIDIVLILIIVTVVIIAFIVPIALIAKMTKKKPNKFKLSSQSSLSQTNVLTSIKQELSSTTINSVLSASPQKTNLRALYEKYEIFDDEDSIIKFLNENKRGNSSYHN